MIASQKSTEFNERFEATFQLGKKGFSDNQIQMGKHSISSLIGGIGYFHGPILVNYADDDEEEKFLAFFYPQEEDARIQYEKKMKAKEDIRYTEPGSLFTATPSRFFFPRGFLWDEGFHQQVLVHWDPVLSKHCLSSWFDRMNEEGWIAREQILGNEAESKDNPEYRVQSKFIANPPTFFLPLTQLLNAEKKRNRKQKNMLETNEFNKLIVSDLEISTPTFLHKLFPKLEKNFDWYLRTQVGVPDDYGRDINNKFVFRWRGRDEGHNLASGLDDYPRTEPPHVGELHVDLSGWMHAYAELLENMARYLGKNFTYYQQARETIEKNLKNYFYNPHEKVFSDLYPSEDELSTLFSTNKGYLSLIPWLLNFNLRGPMYDSGIQLIKELMTKYGVASLHSSNPAFLQSENYWRGNIWINFQYLILRALHHHKEHDSLHAMSLYTKLRKNLIHTISNNFEETGFLFESYDVNTGNGTRVRPFTGWSSLILLIMSEHY
ncbi:Processing alpha glucosidase I [Coelomomyces lativittatus]|nr:Processing alpha glucosidase I [Coelomomyces lativittatus]